MRIEVVDPEEEGLLLGRLQPADGGQGFRYDPVVVRPQADARTGKR